MSYFHTVAGSSQIRVKKGSFSEKGVDNSYGFINNPYHSLFTAPKLFLFTEKILPEVRVPNYHMRRSILEIRIFLFRYTHLHLILRGLFYNWVCACVFHKFLWIGKVFNMANFGRKKSCRFFRDILYLGDQLLFYFVDKRGVYSVMSPIKEFLSLTPLSPVAGALRVPLPAQPPHWELRDRGTYSIGDSKAYEIWSLILRNSCLNIAGGGIKWI